MTFGIVSRPSIVALSVSYYALLSNDGIPVYMALQGKAYRIFNFHDFVFKIVAQVENDGKHN